jgi:hypothetical protein
MSFLLGVFTGLFVWHTAIALLVMGMYASNIDDTPLPQVLFQISFALIFGLLTVLTYVEVL